MGADVFRKLSGARLLRVRCGEGTSLPSLNDPSIKVTTMQRGTSLVSDHHTNHLESTWVHQISVSRIRFDPFGAILGLLGSNEIVMRICGYMIPKIALLDSTRCIAEFIPVLYSLLQMLLVSSKHVWCSTSIPGQ